MICKDHGSENSKTCILGKPPTKKMKYAHGLALALTMSERRVREIDEDISKLREEFDTKYIAMVFERVRRKKIMDALGEKYTKTLHRMSAEEVHHL